MAGNQRRDSERAEADAQIPSDQVPELILLKQHQELLNVDIMWDMEHSTSILQSQLQCSCASGKPPDSAGPEKLAEILQLLPDQRQEPGKFKTQWWPLNSPTMIDHADPIRLGWLLGIPTFLRNQRTVNVSVPMKRSTTPDWWRALIPSPRPKRMGRNSIPKHKAITTWLHWYCIDLRSKNRSQKMFIPPWI